MSLPIAEAHFASPPVESSSYPVGSPVNRMQDLLSNHQQNSALPDLTSYLSQPKMCVRKLLKHSLSVKFIIAKHPQIVEYLSAHINELLHIIFSDDEKLASQGYMVFGHLQSSLIDSILQSSDFHAQIVDVLTKRSDVTRAVSRACNMTALALTMSNGEFPPVCDFIIDFPKYIEQCPIMDFFEEITQDDISYIPVQEWLVASSFPQLITDQINEIEVDSDDYYKSKNLQQLTNLFKLIQFSSTSAPLIDGFRRIETVKAITRFETLHHKVEDARWSALDALYCSESVDIMNGLFNSVVAVLSEPYVTIYNFRLSALHVLEKMLVNDRKLISNFKKTPIYQIILRMILQFSENSFVLLQVEEFLQAVFKNKEINVVYANSLIPPLMYEGTKRENLTMTSFVFKVIDDALAAATKDKMFKVALLQIEDFDLFLQGPLKQRRKLMKEGYGGRLPVAWA